MSDRRWGRALVVALTALSLTGVSACSDEASFCDLATDPATVGDTLSGLNPDDVPGTLAAVREARDVEATLRSRAPGSIRADIDLLVAYLDDLIDGLEAADPTSDERPAIYDQLRPRSEAVSAASARIESYVVANCGDA